MRASRGQLQASAGPGLLAGAGAAAVVVGAVVSAQTSQARGPALIALGLLAAAGGALLRSRIAPEQRGALRLLAVLLLVWSGVEAAIAVEGWTST